MNNEEIGALLCILCVGILVCNLAFVIFIERSERK